jgi:hypothetical protein
MDHPHRRRAATSLLRAGLAVGLRNRADRGYFSGAGMTSNAPSSTPHMVLYFHRFAANPSIRSGVRPIID